MRNASDGITGSPNQNAYCYKPYSISGKTHIHYKYDKHEESSRERRHLTTVPACEGNVIGGVLIAERTEAKDGKKRGTKTGA